MLPTERRAGVWTAVDECLENELHAYVYLVRGTSWERKNVGAGNSHQQIHQTSADATLDDGLNLVVGSVREVGNSPTSVNQNFVI